MAGKKQKPSASDLLAASPVGRAAKWTDTVDPATMRELEGIRKDFQAGRFKRCNPPKNQTDIWKWCREHFGLDVRNDPFTRWLRGETR